MTYRCRKYPVDFSGKSLSFPNLPFRQVPSLTRGPRGRTDFTDFNAGWSVTPQLPVPSAVGLLYFIFLPEFPTLTPRSPFTMGDPIRLSAGQFGSIYEDSFETWARIYLHVEKSKLPTHDSLSSMFSSNVHPFHQD